MVQSKMECPICFFPDHTYFDTVFEEFGISLAYRCTAQMEFWRHPQITLLVKCVILEEQYERFLVNPVLRVV
jgi:hypothetical protein